MLRWFCCFLTTMMLVNSGVWSATVESKLSADSKVIVTLTGVIEPGDYDRVLARIRKANAAGRSVSGIQLHSPGGNLVEGARIAGLLRSGQIASVVLKDAQCASACFVIFAGGVSKYTNYSSWLGVHGASLNGRDASDATIGMAKALRDFGVPPAIIGKMVVTPSTQIVWLTPDDLRSMGVDIRGTPQQDRMAPPKPEQTPAVAAPKDVSQMTWAELAQALYDLSAKQNAGKPQVMRTCEPRQKVCVNAIMAHDKTGDVMLRTIVDANDRLLRRELCTFNQFGDVRDCMDFDSKISSKSMKDRNGDWQTIED